MLGYKLLNIGTYWLQKQVYKVAHQVEQFVARLNL